MLQKVVLLFVAALLPTSVALAAFTELTTFTLKFATFIQNILVPTVFAIALIVFLWGVFLYFIAGGADETKRTDGRKLMLYAIIGFVLMVSIWGIVNLLVTGLGFGNQNIITPKIPGL